MIDMMPILGFSQTKNKSSPKQANQGSKIIYLTNMKVM